MCFTERNANNGTKPVRGSSVEKWQDVAIEKPPSRISDLLSRLRKFKHGHGNNLRLVKGTAATKSAWRSWLRGFINRLGQNCEAEWSRGVGDDNLMKDSELLKVTQADLEGQRPSSRLLSKTWMLDREKSWRSSQSCGGGVFLMCLSGLVDSGLARCGGATQS